MNPIEELLHKVCNEAGRLLNVREAILEPGYGLVSEIELEFENLTATISADEDCDTISVDLSPLPQGREFKSSISSPWRQCVGKRLQWVWSMTNQQGYTDGTRFEFFEPNESDSTIVELVVAASSLETYSVSRQT